MIKNSLWLLLLLLIPITAFGQVIHTLTKIVESTPTITAGAYSSGDQVGGKITLTGSANSSIPTGIISSVELTDKAAQGVDYDVVFFDTDFTAVADNAAADPSDTDLLNIVCVAQITTHIAFADNGTSQAQNVNCPFSLGSGNTSLYVALVVRGTPTYASTSDLTLRVGILQD